MNLLRNKLDQEKIILFFILFLGALLSLCTALLRNDLVWPDDHFQALEPASQIVFNRALLSWEWESGYRSWSLPLLYVPVLWVCKIFGVSGGLSPIYAARVFNVFFSVWGLKKFLELLELLKLEFTPKALTLTAFALWPAMLLWSTTCLADHWVMLVWIIITPTLIKYERREDFWSWLKLGLLAGLPIFFKYQPAIFCVALGALFLYKKKSFRKVFYFSLGILIYPLILAVMDLITYDRFASALIEQLSVGERTSRFYGVAPAYDYIFKITENLGITFFMCLGLSLLIPLSLYRKEMRTWMKNRSLILSFFGVPLIVYLMIHCFIPHKETRFILPFIPALFVLLGIGLELSQKWLSTQLKNFESFTKIKRLIANPIVLIPLLSILGANSFWVTQNTPIYLSSVNIARLEAEVYAQQKEASFSPQCLLLLNHHWSWTRGKLILGDGVTLNESTINDYAPSTTPCKYTILPLSYLNDFLVKTSQYEWRIEKTAENQFILLVRKH